MNWDDLHKPDLSKPVAHISVEALALFDDSQLIELLIRKGVDVRRKTAINEYGGVYYLE